MNIKTGDKMETLKYKIIKSKTQYNEYCKKLESLIYKANKSKSIKEERELLTFLIEKWDQEHNTFQDLEPIPLLNSLMEEHNIKAKDLAELLGISKSMISEILHYKKGLSKESIRILAEHFKLRQEVFNKPYKLVSLYNTYLRNASVMNTQKELGAARSR